MTELLKKGVKFSWNEKCDEAFHTLRAHLTIAPVLAQPDPSRSFDVYCHASGIGHMSRTILLMTLSSQPLYMHLNFGDTILWVPSAIFTQIIRV
jgi:hypothetical protein